MAETPLAQVLVDVAVNCTGEVTVELLAGLDTWTEPSAGKERAENKASDKKAGFIEIPHVVAAINLQTWNLETDLKREQYTTRVTIQSTQGV